MTASSLSTAMSMMSALLPRSMIEARTRCMRAMIPHCIEQLLLPFLAARERAEFIQQMVNRLLVGASQHLSEAEWSELIAQLRHWTGTLVPSEPCHATAPGREAASPKTTRRARHRTSVGNAEKNTARRTR